MKLMVSTNNLVANRMLLGVYNRLVWASDNLETVAHYYEGRIIELDVELVVKRRSTYVRSAEELAQLGVTADNYGYGMALIRYPKGAHWYSFSRKYLQEHVKKMREIFPDLSKWNE